MNFVYLCKIKILGMPFVVLTEELANKWVEKDPKMHYYDIVPVQDRID